MANDLQLSRDVLAKFLPNHQAIKIFEQLTQMVGTDLPDSIVILTTLLEELSISAGTTDSKADQALATLERIASSLDVLAKAPIPATQDDLQPLRLAIGDLQVLPRAELGTMAAQQAENVHITGGSLSGVAITGTGFVVGPAVAVDGNVALFDGVTGSLIKDGGTLGSAAYTSSAAYDPAGSAAAAQAASQPLNAKLTAISGLANAAGLLTNNGAGAFSYTALGTGVATALGVNVGSAGSFVTFNGALGTPSSGVATNLTGTAAALNIGGNAATASSVALGGITGLGANVSTFLATPSSANLAAAVTGETGSGALVFATSPALVTPDLGTPSSGNLSNCTALPVGSISGLGANVSTFLATPSSANLAAAVTGETGSGALVFATSPTLVTPVLGVAAATSISFGDEAMSVYNESSWAGNPTPAGGAFTTISFTGTWTRIGRRIMLNAVFHITNKGTAAGTLLLNLPYTPVGVSPIFGWEDNVVAKAVSGSSTGGAQVEIRMVDGTTIYTNGANYVLFMSFDI